MGYVCLGGRGGLEGAWRITDPFGLILKRKISFRLRKGLNTQKKAGREASPTASACTCRATDEFQAQKEEGDEP